MHISLQMKRLHGFWHCSVESATGKPSLPPMRSLYKLPMNAMDRYSWREGAKDVRTSACSVGCERVHRLSYGRGSDRPEPRPSGGLSPVPGKRAETSQRGAFTRYARLGTSLSLAAFQKLANQAVQGPHPGVVLAVLGENKSKITKRLIELRAVNILCCDVELAICLKRAFGIR